MRLRNGAERIRLVVNLKDGMQSPLTLPLSEIDRN